MTYKIRSYSVAVASSILRVRLKQNDIKVRSYLVAVASSILRVRLKQNDINKVLLRTAPAAEKHADRLTKHIRRQRLKGSLASLPLPSLSFLLRSTNISPLDESS